MKVLLAIAVIGLFSQAQGYAAGQVVAVEPKATKYCQDCVNFFGDVEAIIESNSTSAAIEQYLNEMVCSQLGSFQDMCKQLVEQYVPQYLKYLANQVKPKDVCGVIGMCTQDMMDMIKMKSRAESGVCDLCKEAVTELRTLVKDKNVQDAVKDFLLNTACPALGSLAPQCEQDVDEYLPLLFQVLENELDPTMVCTTLKLCAQSSSVSMSRVGLISLTNAKVINKPKVKDETQCVLCEFVMQKIEALLKENATKQDIEDALEKVCSYLPSTIKAECDDFVKQYAGMIIDLLVQKVSPKEICVQIGLCKSTAKPTMKASNSITCDVCEKVMKELDSLLEQNSTEEEIRKALDKVCDILPSAMKAQCISFVKEYADMIIKLIVEELANPTEICVKLGLCQSTVTETLSASPTCEICEEVIKYLETQLEDSSTQAEIEKALDKVCSILPSSMTDQCVTFINTYAPTILDLLVQELNPQMVCKSLKLCSNTAVKKRAPLKFGGEQCDECVELFNYLDALMNAPSTIKGVTSLLDEVCLVLPTQLRSQCVQFVNEYTGVVMKLLQSVIDPRQICETLKLCTASKKAIEMKNNKLIFKPHMLGTDKCTYGPSYWCDNKMNAIKCGAVKHCQKYVWK